MHRSLLCVLPVVFVACTAPSCSPQQEATAIAAAGPTLDATLCVMNVASTDVAKKMLWPAISADAIKTCGASAEDVAKIWGAHTHAEIAEGVVPLQLVPADAGAPGATP